VFIGWRCAAAHGQSPVARALSRGLLMLGTGARRPATPLHPAVDIAAWATRITSTISRSPVDLIYDRNRDRTLQVFSRLWSFLGPRAGTRPQAVDGVADARWIVRSSRASSVRPTGSP